MVVVVVVVVAVVRSVMVVGAEVEVEQDKVPIAAVLAELVVQEE